MDVMRRRKKTSLMEFFRTGKRYKDVSDEEQAEIERKESYMLDRFDNKIPMPPVGEFKETVKPDPKTFWKLSVLYNCGTVSELTTVKYDREDFCGKDGFNPLLEWFMCSTNPYYLFKHSAGIKIYIRKAINEITIKNFTTDKENAK